MKKSFTSILVIISILIFTGCQRTKPELYSSEEYNFEYPVNYIISTNNDNVLVVQGETGRVEIFDTNDFEGERIHGYSSSGLEEFEYEFVPKLKLSKENYSIWLFYMEEDLETKKEIERIYNSFTINNFYDPYEYCIEKFYIYEDITLENSNYYSNLIEVDATSITEEKIIGKYEDLDFKVQSEKETILNLLNSKYVSTFWHLESELCMIEETNGQKLYRTVFDVSHEYCTNECLVDEYSFSIVIDKKDGVITISP